MRGRPPVVLLSKRILGAIKHLPAYRCQHTLTMSTKTSLREWSSPGPTQALSRPLLAQAFSGDPWEPKGTRREDTFSKSFWACVFCASYQWLGWKTEVEVWKAKAAEVPGTPLMMSVCKSRRPQTQCVKDRKGDAERWRAGDTSVILMVTFMGLGEPGGSQTARH